jgi:hypothetical protein
VSASPKDGPKKPPRVKITQRDNFFVFEAEDDSPPAGRAELMKLLGAERTDTAAVWLSHLHRMTTPRTNWEMRQHIQGELPLNYLLELFHSVEPRDHLERMLLAQMAAVHIATVRTAELVADEDDLDKRLLGGHRALSQLARTFCQQIETLRRYRSGGEQRVTVQHVNVTDGGQAIVGQVTQVQPAVASAPEPPLVDVTATVGDPTALAAPAAVPVGRKRKP